MIASNNPKKEALNTFLVDVFNEILKAEEKAIGKIGTPSLSMREMHVIEAVCNLENLDNRAAAIASALHITAGTLTTSVSILERKGYILRQKDEVDKRVVHIVPTDTGRLANEKHQEFHRRMVDHVMEALAAEEQDAFISGLHHISLFFQSQYEKGKK